MEGPCTLLTLPAPIPDIGHTESPAEALYVEDGDIVRHSVLRFGILTQRALPCQEVGALPDGRIAVRNSNHPDAGAVFFTRAEMHAWVQGAKAGEFDDLGA